MVDLRRTQNAPRKSLRLNVGNKIVDFSCNVVDFVNNVGKFENFVFKIENNSMFMISSQNVFDNADRISIREVTAARDL